jgi:hypothetical protein
MSIYYGTNPDFTRVMEHPVVRNVRVVCALYPDPFKRAR